MADTTHEVVIIGGGFGGLYAAQSLGSAAVHVTLLDRRNHHLFQPLLYQVATGGLSPANISAPLRSILRGQKNTEVLLAEVTDIDVPGHRVLLADGGAIRYDTLIVAAGARHAYFGHPEWEPLAPGLKAIEDATILRRRVLLAFEKAERATEPDDRQACLTFVVAGGGPTGVEMAGAISELAHYTLRKNFRHIDPAMARILLVEGADRVLTTFDPRLSGRALRSLQRFGVEVRLKTLVTDVKPDRVILKHGDQTEEIRTHFVMWAAGVQASPLGAILGRATDAVVDRAGRVTVEPDLSLPGHPEIFVVGDMAAAKTPDGQPVPGVAPAAMQEGRYVARLIRKRLKEQTLRPFRYWDKGSVATIGRASAVVDLYWFRFSGPFAWLAWLFIHIMFLIQFENRILVLWQWFWNYITRNRAARLITNEPAPPHVGDNLVGWTDGQPARERSAPVAPK